MYFILLFLTTVHISLQTSVIIIGISVSSVLTQTPSKRAFLSNDKEQKGREDIDHISDLPNSVICHILSFLYVASVTSSVLSKRWINLWTIVPALSFRSSEFTTGFVDCVCKVLALSRAQTIHQFSLDFESMEKVDAQNISPWTSVAIKHNVQELELNFCTSSPILVTLAAHVFSCKTLVCLKLFDDIYLDALVNVCLPSLRILQIECVHSDGSFDRLLSSCPILKDLIRITVKGPSTENGFYKFLINAPMLETMKLLDLTDCNVQVGDLPNLVEAAIDLDILYEDGLGVLFRKIGNLKFLSLSDSTFGSTRFRLQFPMFSNLVCLEITTCCELWYAQIHLLRCADNLKALVFHINVPLYHLGRKCIETLPETAPKCVVASLKTLKLTGFFDQGCNRKLVRYVLKNAEVLKELKIGTSLRLKNRCRHLKNLLKCPKASTACEIGFFIDSSGQKYNL
ncbi:hypothetical protein V6N13_016257 [Hibiscus sabdariffa]